jgi:fructokinase
LTASDDLARPIFGFGELLWDILPGGKTIGGAPFNVLAQLARLGHEVAFASAVGRDALGKAALEEVAARDIDTTFIARVEEPTGVAQVGLGEDGSPSFELARPAAYEALHFDDGAISQIVALDPAALVCGTLAHAHGRLLESTRSLAAKLEGAAFVYDVNLRDGWWTPALVHDLMRIATVVKLSAEEAETLVPTTGVRWGDYERYSRALAASFELDGVAVTAGGSAASLLLGDEFACAVPPKVRVRDAVGAGDAFTAGLVDGIVSGRPPSTILTRATSLGALVASADGALPAWTPEELAQLELRAVSTGTGAGRP